MSLKLVKCEKVVKTGGEYGPHTSYEKRSLGEPREPLHATLAAARVRYSRILLG